jgi:acyl-CoA thioesterase-1
MSAPLPAALAGDRPATWVFTGDSITHGVLHTHGWRSYVEHFQERLRGELGRMTDWVVNTGVSGDRTVDVLGSFDERVTRFAPAVVSVLLGTNDATAAAAGTQTFSGDLTAIVAAIRGTGATPLLHTPPWIDVAGAPERASLGDYAAVVRDVAERNDVALVDHYQEWCDRPVTERHSWLADPFHPNERGHLEMARTLFRRLGIFDPASPTCALEIP